MHNNSETTIMQIAELDIYGKGRQVNDVVTSDSVDNKTLLEIKDLSVAFNQNGQQKIVVNQISFSIRKGETVALIGESGSGKSVTALSIMQLLTYPLVSYPSGSILFNGQQLIGADNKYLRKIRGNRMTMIFQEPMASLNPLHTVKRHIGESLQLHSRLTDKQEISLILKLLHQVSIDNPERHLNYYPHQLSGGQRQRVMIAAALAHKPDILIADEPTTALDNIVQAQIIELLKKLQRQQGMGILLITHDFNVVRKVADHVCIMMEGKIVEQGKTCNILTNAQHPYTQHLLASEPKGEMPPTNLDAPIVMQTHDLKVWFPIKRGLLRKKVGHVKVVEKANVTLRAGHTLGIAGQSGSGKTTLALAMLRLIPSHGRIVYLGKEIQTLSYHKMRPLRRKLQIVFQDPYGALSPRLSVARIIEEGLLVHHKHLSANQRKERIITSMLDVALEPADMNRYPHEFSGGQRQRISIARAIILQPDIVILDEPTSSLDVSVQTEIISLLRSLQLRHGLSYLFISHDLRAMRTIAHDIIVMHHGKIVEQGSAKEILNTPKTTYAQALIRAAIEIKITPEE